MVITSNNCCIDLDGVLNYYPRPWLRFLEKNGYSYSNIKEAKERLSYQRYVNLKRRYRKSLDKRFALCRHGAPRFINQLRSMGYRIIVTTTRPIGEHPHLVPWTVEWLLGAGIVYDDVLFNHHQWIVPLEHYPNLIFVVDDDPKKIEFFKKRGIKGFLFSDKEDFERILEQLRCESPQS